VGGRTSRAEKKRGRYRRGQREREFFIDNLLVRIQFIIEMVWWTGLAPWEFEFPFPGSLISTCLGAKESGEGVGRRVHVVNTFA